VTTGRRIGTSPGLIKLSQNAKAFEVAYASSACIPKPALIALDPPRRRVLARIRPTDLLFITLNKSEAPFSPSTRYNDYAISTQEFHWESQSLTREASATGQRYIHHRARGAVGCCCLCGRRTGAAG
jgi:hypothetical protein